LYRQAGLEQIGVTAHAGVYPPGHSRRTLLPDLVSSLGRAIADKRELALLDEAVRQHLADPHTLMMPHLFFAAWGRKPTG
jgi:hypothetical protein